MKMRVLTRGVDPLAEDTDGVSQRAWSLELCFIERVQEKNQASVGGEPAEELIAGSDLKGIFKRGVDRLDAYEEGLFAALMDLARSGPRLEGLARAGFGEDQHAAFARYLVPALRLSRDEIEKVPVPRPRRKRREPPNDFDGNLFHDRDPALAGYRFGNHRSATSAGKARRSGARCDEAVSMPRSTRAAVTFLAPRSS
jgi:hypothetical protein